MFGAWTYAAHSIHYDALPGFFLVFAVRDDPRGTWRSWEDTASLAKHLGVPTVPALARGSFATEAALRDRVEDLAPRPSSLGGAREGIVVRVAGPFVDFAGGMAKWVRAGHVQTPEDWAHRPFQRNQLRP